MRDLLLLLLLLLLLSLSSLLLLLTPTLTKMREDRHAVCVGLYNTSYTPIPFASVRPMFRACVRGEKGDMPFVLVIAAHPALERVWPMFRAGSVRVRVGEGLVAWKSIGRFGPRSR